MSEILRQIESGQELFSDTAGSPANIHFMCFAISPFVMHIILPRYRKR